MCVGKLFITRNDKRVLSRVRPLFGADYRFLQDDRIFMVTDIRQPHRDHLVQMPFYQILSCYGVGYVNDWDYLLKNNMIVEFT